MQLLNKPTRYMFFTGKGGVGKTSVACATAVNLADSGKNVLLVSTDPASNLSDVLGFEVGTSSTVAPELPTLSVMNIDPEAAASTYRDRVIGPYREKLGQAAVQSMEEQLSGACTTEIAAFDEFTSILIGKADFGDFDHILFDTAPTGHTIRLLQLPSSWSSFLETNEHGASCLGPHSGLTKQQEQYMHAVEILSDATKATIVLVTRPEFSSIQEADRTAGELAGLNITNHFLVLNGLLDNQKSEDSLAQAIMAETESLLEQLPPNLESLPREDLALKPYNILGVDLLRTFFSAEQDAPEVSSTEEVPYKTVEAQNLAASVEELGEKDHGLIMVMGKGGVGKTTVAAALAIGLAKQGKQVHLTTTDPADHISATVDHDMPGLKVSRIDPAEETEKYKQHVLEHSGKDLDEDGRALLEEDLRSPCTEEVAVFHAFSRIVSQARREIVVMDTAPTGHTLLLLDATGSYHKDVVRNLKGAGKVVTPLMRLQDRDFTKILLVTLPETTPIHEAAALQDDLRRASIEPYTWVINRSLAASDTQHPILKQRAQAELPRIQEVQEHSVNTPCILPWLPERPIGNANLEKLLTYEAVSVQ